MLGRSRKAPRLPRDVEEVFEAALARLGAKVGKWKGVVLHFERRDEPGVLDTSEHLEILDDAPARTPVDGLAIYLGSRLGIPVPEDLALDLRAVRPWLRPRVLPMRALEGPSRAMCRRPAFGTTPEHAPAPDLISAVSVGAGRSATFVTTRALDAWNLEFDDVMKLAFGNLRRLVGPDDLHDVESAGGGGPGAEGVLSLNDPSLETGASAALVIDHLLPESATPEGVLFGVPSLDTFLALPVRRGAGARSLAALVQVVFTMTSQHAEPLSEVVLWRRATSRGGQTDAVPMTSIHEGASRRVHLEAHGVVEELLRILGEIE
ncbi:MAG: hypothetical protein ACKVZJ_04845 [Phycisphaerales bacterium]